ncbi:MAG TPA: biopolymer transporter ExbD [Acidobacteriaceae bacterium]|nr:biopolymer transporter ExbD [Acidobacteriaceae bacterium]
MSFSSSNSSQQAEINVTPLIDVLLVLLIIFMVIVPVMPRGLESRVPDKSEAAERLQAPVSLRVLGDDAAGVASKISYEVNGRVVERADLSAALLAVLRVRAERAVYVSASSQASYREVADAVGAAKAAGATTVALGRQ